MKEAESTVKALCKISGDKWTWNGESQSFKTCFPNVTQIDYQDFIISPVSKSTILGVRIENKKNIKFLPINLNRSFPKLIAFQASNCSIISVEIQFKGLSQLEYLNLNGNEIKNVTNDAFKGLNNLEFLSLKRNNIKTLGKDIFKSLTKVEAIWVSDNQIRSLDEDIFKSLANLKNISLTKNKLVSIPKNVFKNNWKLQRVWLKDNEIKSIDARTFDFLLALKYVDLQGNVCVNKIYTKTSFMTMKIDLRKNCDVNLVQALTKELLFLLVVLVLLVVVGLLQLAVRRLQRVVQYTQI